MMSGQVTNNVEDILSKYLISRDKLLFSNKLYELGYSEIAKYILYMGKEVEFISKPISVTLMPEKMVLTFPNGIKATLHYALIKHKPEEFYNLLRIYVKWRVVMRYEPIVVKYEELSFEPAYDVADKLLAHINPIDIFVRGLGYKIHHNTYRLLIPRLLPLIKTPYPIHVWQFTRYNSGKTHYGVMLMKVFRFFYSTSVPTQAGLLYDARTGTYGWALLSDGVVFDEIDKWNIQNLINYDILSYLPTLMEQGIVVRPTTRHTFMGIIERRIPFLFMGNVPPLIAGGESWKIVDRSRLSEYLLSWGDHTGAISDRIAIVDIDDETPLISDYVEDTVLPESILIAVRDLINSRVNEVSSPQSALSGRMKRHSEMLYIALNVLGAEASIEETDQIVAYGWSVWWKNVRKMQD